MKSSPVTGGGASAVGRTASAHPVVLWVILRVALVLAGVGVLTVSAWLSVPFYPVPLTMQTLAVLLVGGLLGPRLGASAVAGYLAVGLMGAPVFHNGLGGVAVFGGPTGGYLVGFLPAAFLMGLAVRWAGITAGRRGDLGRMTVDGAGRGDSISSASDPSASDSGSSLSGASTPSALAGGWKVSVPGILTLISGAVLASVAIYVFGVPWLAWSTHSTLGHALDVGAVPFVLGDVLKAAVAIGAIRMGGAALCRRGLLPF